MKISALWVLTLGIILIAGSARAQLFQASIGVNSPTGTDVGFGGVTPLPARGGYISVGSTNPFGGNDDVYVVKTDLMGNVVWAYAYNFTGYDYGHDIHLCANGDFIITGLTNSSGVSQLILLRINSSGGAIWARRSSVPQSLGFDVLEAANGDIVAAGWVGLDPNRSGLIVRVTGTGGHVFTTQYSPIFNPDMDDYLQGLWEAANGDLIACGSTNSYGAGYQGWLLRTSGAGVPVWSNHIGGGFNERFNSVVELGASVAEMGNIVAVGSTNGIPGDPQDYYMAKFTGAGAQLGPDIAGGKFGSNEEMYQIRENRQLNTNTGDLVLAGRMLPGPLGEEDGYVVVMSPTWNCPDGEVWSMAYGGTMSDRLHSAHEDPDNCIPGYILCGFTNSPGFVPPGNPLQQYLVKTDDDGVSGCYEMRPDDRCVSPGYTSATAPVINRAASETLHGLPFVLTGAGGDVVCLTECPLEKRNISDAGSVMESLSDVFPNPVATGGTFEMEYFFTRNDEASIVVSDMAGRIVYNGMQQVNAGAGSVMVSTEGWASGVYAVKINAGGETRTQRVVVMDR